MVAAGGARRSAMVDNAMGPVALLIQTARNVRWHILLYGDSLSGEYSTNSPGCPSTSAGRGDENPHAGGRRVRVVEDCLSGRRTVWDVLQTRRKVSMASPAIESIRRWRW
jgi:hypothetical protein